MHNLNELYELTLPFTLRVIPLGLPIKINVLSKDQSSVAHLINPLEFMEDEEIGISDLGLPALSVGEHIGVATVLHDDYCDLNAKKYEESLSCFDSPQQMILHQSKKDCEHLTFLKDEIINCSSMYVLVNALGDLIRQGVHLKAFEVNGKLFNVEKMKIISGEGVADKPLVNSNGIVRRTVKFVRRLNGNYSNTYVIRRDQQAPHYLQSMILFDDFLLVDEEPRVRDEMSLCPACVSELIVVDDEWNCTDSACYPFMEAFLNSIARQSGLGVETLRQQYMRGEKFHYPIDCTIEEQSREEVPIDCVRTYYDVLKLDGLHSILERFFGFHNEKLYCSKAEAIDEMFYRYLTLGSVDKKEYSRPVCYYLPLNSKPKVLTLGTFDGLTEQTLELKLAEYGIGVTKVVQEADLAIIGVVGESEEFYHYIKEVSNVLMLETNGHIFHVFDLMKYF